MLTQSSIKYLTNPMIALLAVIVYVVLWQSLLPIPYAMAVGLFVTLLLEAILRGTFKSRVYSLPYYMLVVVFAAKILLWIFGHKYIENEYAYFLLGEIFMILQLIGLRIGRGFINAHFFKEKSFLAKALLNDYFMTLVMFKYALLIHVLFLLLYQEIMDGYISEQLDYIEQLDYVVHIVVPIFIIIFFLVYQFFRTRYLTNKLQIEEWLPIVNEAGEVKGRIARSVSQGFKNKYMHPVVRVALICKDKIYLQERDANYIVDPRKIDHPFEKYILFKHEIEDAVKNCVKIQLGYLPDAEPQFICQYTFETELTNRLIFLFSVKVDDECAIVKAGGMNGKFWTMKQIEDDFGNEIFGECFEMEYEYLKHVVVLDDADALLVETP